MFAHQVIEDLESWKPLGIDNSGSHSISLINNSQKFHFGTVTDVYDVIGIKKRDDRPNIFMDDLGYDVNLPYPICWFDIIAKNIKGRQFKEGILLEDCPHGINAEIDILSEIDNERHTFKINRPKGFFVYIFGSLENGKWIISPWSFYISPNHRQNNYLGMSTVFEPIMAYNTGVPQFAKDNLDASFEILSVLNLCLLILNCKNIGTETTPAPVKLNNKRKKKGKLPIYSYKTLVIKPITKKEKAIPKHLWNNRIHLARGHFKTYTEDKPRFGRVGDYGRFWVRPHVRGQNHEGVVMKDYKVGV